MLRHRHLRGRCALVNVGQEAKHLQRLHALLQLILALSIEHGLSLTLLLSTNVVQEVHILLAQTLLLSSQTSQLSADRGLLATQRAQPLRQLLANAELLAREVADTLRQALTKLRLLAIDVGLLPCELPIKPCQSCLLRAQLAILRAGPCDGLATRKLTLLLLFKSLLCLLLSSTVALLKRPYDCGITLLRQASLQLRALDTFA